MVKTYGQVDSVEQALAFSCFLKDYIELPPKIELFVRLEDIHTYTLGAETFYYVDYLLYKGFYDNFDEFFRLFRESGIDGKCACENYQYGKSILHEKGGFFGKTRVWCPAIAIAAGSHERERFGTATPAFYSLSHVPLESYRRNIDMNDVDRCIRPLVSALNSIEGTATIYSCGGHRLNIVSTDFSIRNPWVTFHCDVKTAWSIWHVVQKLDLNYRWELSARIRNECPRFNPDTWWLLTTRNRWFSRKRINQDIARLSCHLSSGISNACPKVQV